MLKKRCTDIKEYPWSYLKSYQIEILLISNQSYFCWNFKFLQSRRFAAANRAAGCLVAALNLYCFKMASFHSKFVKNLISSQFCMLHNSHDQLCSEKKQCITCHSQVMKKYFLNYYTSVEPRPRFTLLRGFPDPLKSVRGRGFGSPTSWVMTEFKLTTFSERLLSFRITVV